jgi:hypothetical protein
MSSWRKGYGRFGAAAAILLTVAACSTSVATWRPPVKGSGAIETPAASAAFVALPDASGPKASGGPRSTGAVGATVDMITADYTYKSELITPLGHLYGKFLDDYVIVTVENGNTAPVKVVVASEVTGYTDKTTDTVTVPAGGSQEIRQNPSLTAAAIDGLSTQHQADLHVTVSYIDSGVAKIVLDQTSQTLVTSRRDFPWAIDPDDQKWDFNLVAAMITPADPGVEALIRAAANYDPSGGMCAGYSSPGDEKGAVYQCLADIWQAEANDYNLTYISTTISFAAGQSQRIRLPSEVLDQSSGNCIELTLLYASVAEAMGMDAAIILIPGHAFVGISVDNKDENYYFIETTMIGQATFAEAAKYGLKEWNEASPHLAAGEHDYGWVDVPTVRQEGIVPIPWH